MPTAERAAAVRRWLWSPAAAVRRALGLVVRICVPLPVRAVTAAAVHPVARWVWATRPRRVLVRAVVWWHALGGFMVVGPVAWADSTAGVPGNVVLSWMDVTDSSGISVWRYFLSIDEGGANDWQGTMSSWLIQFEFEIFRGLAGTSIWFIGWALGFEWLDMLLGPVETLSEAISSITGQLGLAPTLMVVAALIAGVWIARGKWATGTYEFVMTAAIAAAAVTMLSNPLAAVTGDDGVLTQSQTMGLELGSALASGGDFDQASPDEMIRSLKAAMADTLIRQPTQLLNFGRVLDTESQQCLDAWNAGHEDVPGNDKDTLKDNIAGCGGESAKQMKDFADHPGTGQVFAGALLIVAGGLTWVFGLVLAGALVVAGMWALYSAISLLVTLVWGLIPGVGRGPLLKNLAMVIVSCAMLVVSILFLVAYLLIIRAFFQDQGGGELMRRVFYVDVVLIVGIIMFRRVKKRMQTAADRFAAKLGKRPGGASPTKITRGTAAVDGRARLRQGRDALRSTGPAVKGAGSTAVKVGKVATVAGRAVGAATGGTTLLATGVVYRAVEGVRAIHNKTKSTDTDATRGGKDVAAPPESVEDRSPALTPMSTAPRDIDTEVGSSTSDRNGATSGRSRYPTGILRTESAEPGISRSAHSARVSASGETVRAHGGTFREFAAEGGSKVFLPVKNDASTTGRSRARAPQFSGKATGSGEPRRQPKPTSVKSSRVSV